MDKKMLLFGLFVLAGALFAQLSTTNAALNDLCAELVSLLPIAAMLMIVLAGVIYAAGQIMGAETRARANVWATACLTGALISVLIVVIAPGALGIIYGVEVSCTATAQDGPTLLADGAGCSSNGQCTGGTCCVEAGNVCTGAGTITCCPTAGSGACYDANAACCPDNIPACQADFTCT